MWVKWLWLNTLTEPLDWSCVKLVYSFESSAHQIVRISELIGWYLLDTRETFCKILPAVVSGESVGVAY